MRDKLNRVTTNYYYLAGPPGSSKLIVSKVLFIYALCLGLNIIVTSIPSDQSSILEGTHLHLLFKLAIHTKSIYHPLQEANLCIHKLTRNNAALAYLHSIDVLMIEEIGLLNSELYSTIEIVLQHIIKNDLKAGGMLIISNGNLFQLMNITSLSFWLSNHFIF